MSERGEYERQTQDDYDRAMVVIDRQRQEIETLKALFLGAVKAVGVIRMTLPDGVRSGPPIIKGIEYSYRPMDMVYEFSAERTGEPRVFKGATV